MAPLQVTLETSVTKDQIDHLGHMNVRFYGRHAQHATATLLERFGVDPALDAPTVSDRYTRHLHEQLLGANLEVRSGVVSADSSGLRFYHELANRSDGDIAATFVHGIPASPAITDAVIDMARSAIVDIPAHGATRTLSLDHDPITHAPALDDVIGRGLAMRLPRAVMAEECDADGTYITEFAPMLMWAGEAPDGRRGDQMTDGPNGEKMAWASMESRLSTVRFPRLGDQIQAFSALIEMRDKITHRVQWVYDLEQGDLLAAFETVSLAFDTVARRPMSIPDSIRELESAQQHPDLVPHARR